MSALRRVCSGRCLLLGGVCSRGVAAAGSCLLRREGACSRGGGGGGGIPVCTEADPLWTDRQV